MKLYCALLVLCVGTVLADEIQLDEGVLVLTKDNFQSAIDSNEHVLVEFYAPWCGHCKALAPEYAKAATKLAADGSAVKLGKVDATEHGSLAEEHGVRGYPTLKFFRKGKPTEYGGGRTSDEIINWLTKKTGPPALELTSVEAAKKLVEDKEVCVIGFFKDQASAEAKEFLEAASSVDEYTFGITSDEAVFTNYETTDGKVILFKKFDEGKVVFDGDLKADEVVKFISTNALPLVVEFNHETASKIFGGDIKSHMLIFLSKKDGHFDKYVETARTVAKEFKGKLVFVTINTDEEDHVRIMEYFGMTKEEIPSLRIIRLEEDMAKYKPENAEITVDNLTAFVKKFLDGELKQHLLSDDLPEDWDKNPVKVLVATKFDEVAFNKEADVLVEFYAPWCGHCKQLAPIYDELGEKFKDNSAVVIAKMDSTTNELEHTKIQSFPTIKLYKKETNEVVEYGGDRTLEGLTKFIESGGETGKAAEDEMEEDEQEEDSHTKDEL